MQGTFNNVFFSYDCCFVVILKYIFFLRTAFSVNESYCFTSSLEVQRKKKNEDNEYNPC